MKKLLSMFLACVLLLGILPTSAWAADSVEAALGEVDIYNGGYELGYLSINGAVKKQDYTYFMYKSNDGTTKEVPAYCVNPYLKGVPQKVEPGESIKYLAEERSSDPKVVGININQIARSVNAGIATAEDARRGLFLLDKVYELMYQVANP